jgi:hypothetical protein
MNRSLRKKRKRMALQSLRTRKQGSDSRFEITLQLVKRPVQPLSERLRKPIWCALSAIMLVFYFWTATSSYKPFHPRDTANEFYNQLTDSLLQGHTYLSIPPPPQLLALRNPYDPQANERFRLQDASLYRGRYYLYFGLAPALTLYAPWRILMGKRLSDDVSVTIFCFGGYIFSCLLLFLLLDASQIRAPWFLQGAAVLALGLGQIAPIVLRRPRVYEVAVSAAFCFFFAGLYALARTVLRPGTGRWLPAISALLLGLATASRPQCAIVAILLAFLYAIHLARSRAFNSRRWWTEVARFAIPLAVAGLLIAWYNYARFGNPFELGHRYQVGTLDYFSAKQTALALRLRQLLTSLYYFVLCPINLMPRFPFLELSGAAQPFGDPDLFPVDFFHEPVASFLLITPLSALAFAFPFLAWKRKLLTPEVRDVLTSLLLSSYVLLAIVLTPRSVSPRYELDFVPGLLVAALFLSLFLTVRLPLRWMRTTAAALTCTACFWAVLANMALSVNSYGYPLEKPYNPLFRSIATHFGAGLDAFMQDVAKFHFAATITFPNARSGTREAIFAAGIWERWDLLFVQYQPGSTAIFSFVHAGVSDTQTSPIPVSPGTPHRLTADYSAAEKRLVMRLDDKVILDYPTTFHPTSRDRITVGSIRAGSFRVRDFSGKIQLAPNGLVFVPRPGTPAKS